MTVYTFSEARQKLASLLERAREEGGVRIKRRDGQVFLVRPEQTGKSPLDTEGVTVGLSADEIVQFVRVGREDRAIRARTPRAKRLASAAAHKRVTGRSSAKP